MKMAITNLFRRFRKKSQINTLDQGRVPQEIKPGHNRYTDRDLKILYCADNGVSATRISEVIGLSTQRVSQIIYRTRRRVRQNDFLRPFSGVCCVEEVAEILGVSPRRVQQLTQGGYISKLRHGNYDLAAAVLGFSQFKRETNPVRKKNQHKLQTKNSPQIGVEQSMHPPIMWNVNDVASWLRISKRQVYNLIAQGDLPEPIKVGNQNRWIAAELQEHVLVHSRGCQKDQT
jgi:predicted DNA-binding transcriptional regulator AlpA/DNA-binding transcriptional MerR regulator